MMSSPEHYLLLEVDAPVPCDSLFWFIPGKVSKKVLPNTKEGTGQRNWLVGQTSGEVTEEIG